MSSILSPSFGANYLPGDPRAESLSIALIGPDKERRRTVASALAESPLANVSEFESYPTRPEEFQWLLEKSFHVIVLDLDSDPGIALDLVERVRASDSATIMVYSERADAKLAMRYMRAGAREFLLLPLEEGLVADALHRAATTPSEKAQPSRAAAGKLLVFVCAKGGSGVTTVACNLALALAANPDQKTLLIDLALPIGDAALALGISAKYSTEDALRNAHRLDAGLLKELLVKHESGAFVLAAPNHVIEVDGRGDAIDKVIAVARREFDHVIVDVGSRMDLVGTDLFKRASTVYLVTLTGVSELRNSNRLISQFFPAGGPNLEVVINRFESRLLAGVNEDVVMKALGRPVRWKIPEDRETAREMQYGVTGVGETRVSRLSMEMAGAITGRPVPPEKKKGFSLKRLGKSLAEEASGNDDPLSIKIVPQSVVPPPRSIAPPPRSIAPLPRPIAPPTRAMARASEVMARATPVAATPAPATAAATPAAMPAAIPSIARPIPAIAPVTPAIAPPPPAIARTTPDIRWPEPAAIAYGDALSPAQLNASASVEGTFVYTPGLGSVLPAGMHTLSVSFTPADSENYTTAQATVPLHVEKATPVIAWPKPDPIPYGAALGAGQLRATASVPGRFDYSPAPGEVLAAGRHKLSATFTPADTENYARIQAAVLLTVARATPIIEWPAPRPIEFGTRISARQLCATASIPGRLDYSVAPGTVLGVGTHTLAVRFTPTQADNYATVEVNVPLLVERAAPVIAWPTPQPIVYGTPLSERQLCATASVPGTFHYSLALGAVPAAGTHTLAVTFTPTDSANYAKVQATVSLQVAKATPVLEWPPLKPALCGTPLSSRQLCATASVPGKFDYSPALGEMLAAGTHMLSVIFTPTDIANYATAQAAVPLTVLAKAKPVIAWSAPDPITYGTPLSSSQLCATASVPGSFHYSAQPGEVLEAGTHSLAVTFTPTDSVNYAEAQATVSLKVARAMPAIDWPAPKPIIEGTLLSATQLCAAAPVPGRFDYSTLPGVALPPGQHTLSVIFTPADRANYATAEATVPLTVVAKAIPAVAWPKPVPITYGTALSAAQLSASASVPGTFEYSPGPGVVLTAGTHTLSVIFTPSDADNYAEVETTVPLQVDRATPVVAWSNPEPVSYGVKLSARQLNATASVPGRFDYSPWIGAVLAAGTHTLSATFTPTDSANYTAVRATVSLEVARAIPDIEWPAPVSIRCETALGEAHLCARSPVPGTFEYVPGAGQVLPVGRHTLSVTFTPADTANYTSTEASISVNVVLKPTPVIAWPTPDPISYGTPLGSRQLCATASVPGRFSYSVARGEVLAAGTHTLSVTFDPADSANYATAQATVLLTVEKATPTIDWQAPHSIKPGTPLSDAQLAAAAWVPGTFVYSPAADQVLTLGTHTLSVTFFPEDSANYNTAHATVTLDVEDRTMAVITWPSPEPIIHGTALGPAQLCATASVPGTFTYSPARGEVLTPGIHTLSVTFRPAKAEDYLPAQATVELRVEAARNLPKMRPASRFDEDPERFEKSVFTSQGPRAGVPTAEARWTPAPPSLPESIRPQPVQSSIQGKGEDEGEGKGKRNKARMMWMIAAGYASLVLLLTILAVPLYHWGMKWWAESAVAPVPAATDTQLQPNEPTRSPRTRPAYDERISMPKAVKPTSVQSEMMHDQLAAPARIPQNTQQQVAANAPPPVSLPAAGMAAMSSGGAMGNVFDENTPPVVAAAPPPPLAISAAVAMTLLVQKKLPVYPLIARQAGVSGTVQLEALISQAGVIEDLHVVNGPALLRQAALDAVRAWRYRPYMVNNKPREVKTAINVTFSLGG